MDRTPSQVLRLLTHPSSVIRTCKRSSLAISSDRIPLADGEKKGAFPTNMLIEVSRKTYPSCPQLQEPCLVDRSPKRFKTLGHSSDGAHDVDIPMTADRSIEDLTSGSADGLETLATVSTSDYNSRPYR
jgi:hypothetical protein